MTCPATTTRKPRLDLRRFPFDRHSLEILLEEGAEEENTLTYAADVANSGHSVHASVGGWRVAGMRVEVAPASYATNFGDPTSPAQAGSRFTRVRAILELERTEYTGFLKLTATLYSAFPSASSQRSAIMPTTFAPRIAVLAISFFALVVSMRAASAARPTLSDAVVGG